MKKNIIILLFVLNQFSFSQTSIPSELMNKESFNKFYETKENNVSSMIVNDMEYSKTEIFSNRWTYNYSKDSIILGKLESRDILKSTFEYKLSKNKKIIESKVYFYNNLLKNDFLHIKTIYSDTSKTLLFLDKNIYTISKMVVKLDSLKSPVSIITYNAENEIIAKETAKYNYSLDIYSYNVYNSYDEIVLSTTESYNHDYTLKKNEYNDIIEMIWPTSKDKAIILFHYKYDKNGNWINRERKGIENNKEVLYSKTTRKIRYKD